jgi:hypothetical protein
MKPSVVDDKSELTRRKINEMELEDEFFIVSSIDLLFYFY